MAFEDEEPDGGPEGESIQARIDRLGRQRPAKFDTIWTEIGFCFSLLASMVMAVNTLSSQNGEDSTTIYTASKSTSSSGFNVILPTLATVLDIPAQSQTWPASVFSLITGAFLLPFTRIADTYSGFAIFLFGLVCFTIWSLIGGFSRNYLMLNFCRALQGLGPAAFLPASVSLLGSIYHPGPRRNSRL